MASFWMVAAGCAKQGTPGKDTHLAALKSSLSGYCEGQPLNFDVPTTGLKFGSFDDLIRLTDDMAKYDSQVEGICRRIERMYLEVEPSKGADPMNDIKILSNTQTLSFSQYMKEWTWDEAKYPKQRGLSNTVALLLSTATKLDEEARGKASQFNEAKTAQANMVKKQQGGLLSRDLIDVLTPGTVRPADFVQTEHMQTVIMILQETAVEQFLNEYESYAAKVVPLSAKQFTNIVEEDGTQIWRVVMFKSAVEAFTKKVRENRIGTARLFEYSENTFEKLKVQRQELTNECDKQEKLMKAFCKASFSDVMVAWVHVKAMRVFVESTLRFGVPPIFAAFIIQPLDSKLVKARQAVANAIGTKSKNNDAPADSKDDQGDEEYFPYVSINFMPFAAKAGF